MIVLAGADLVLPDRIQRGGSLVLDADRIVAIESEVIDGPSGALRIDLRGHLIVPGFIDVHVHGLEGIDVLDGPSAVAAVASKFPRHGVTSFCPTSVACPPAQLQTFLASVGTASQVRSTTSARVLPAHLESNFINPEWNGAQPKTCLRTADGRAQAILRSSNTQSFGGSTVAPTARRWTEGEFSGADILAVVEAYRRAVGIVTLAPELPGGLELVRHLVAAGHRVSIGHSGATYEEAIAAIDAGVRHATHLYNRMSPLTSRSPGVVGAVLESEAVAAEVICDGFHVHPSSVAVAIRAKSVDRMMAITDGTAGSGLAVGERAQLGGQPIIVTPRSAVLEDGTLAGSILTMDAAFRLLVERVGLSPVDAARMCATTPAAELKLGEIGRIGEGFIADLTVLSPGLRVRHTFVGGEHCFPLDRLDS